MKCLVRLLARAELSDPSPLVLPRNPVAEADLECRDVRGSGRDGSLCEVPGSDLEGSEEEDAGELRELSRLASRSSLTVTSSSSFFDITRSSSYDTSSVASAKTSSTTVYESWILLL